MANNFRNALSINIGTSETTIYTCPNNTTATVIGMNVANRKSPAQDIQLDIRMTDVSTGTTAYVVRSAPVPTGSSMVSSGGIQKIVLEAGDQLKVTSNVSSSIDVILSMLEITT